MMVVVGKDGNSFHWRLITCPMSFWNRCWISQNHQDENGSLEVMEEGRDGGAGLYPVVVHK